VADVEATVEIEATASTVWSIVADLAKYPEWNPFIPSISGELRVGARLEVEIRPEGGSSMRFRPTLLVADAGRELRWRGRLGVPGLFDGTHSLRVEAIDATRSRFIHHESFRGILVPLVWRGKMRRGTELGFARTASALKERAERTTGATATPDGSATPPPPTRTPGT
jgi:hypothetical protein